MTPALQALIAVTIIITTILEYVAAYVQEIPGIAKKDSTSGNKEASRLYAELLLCVCWHSEHI